MVSSFRACKMAASCTFIKRASFILWMPVFLYRKSNKQLNVLRFCCTLFVTVLRVTDKSYACIDGPVFSDTRSEFMQNELTITRNRPTLLRAEQRLTAPFLRLARRLKLNTTFVMDNRRILMGLVYPVRFGGFLPSP